MVLGALALWGTRAGADVTSDRPGSVVIWPKVIADGTRDTLIALTNTSNSQAYAHCEYILGTGVCSLTPQYCSIPGGGSGAGGSPDCRPIGNLANQCIVTWQLGDFDVILTRQQPTIWRVSTGRVENLGLPPDAKCVDFDQMGTPRQSCPGLFPVGNVPPPPQAALFGNTSSTAPTFRGELRCIQVNPDGSPLAMNALKGEAIIETLGTNQTSEYSAIDILGDDGVSDASPNVLKLNGIQYNACPEAVDVTHYAPNADDLVADQLGAPCAGGCPVRTELTITPCRSDFADRVGTPFNALFNVWDEFEVFQSLHQPFDCWANVDLTQLHFGNQQHSTFQHTQITSSGSGICISGTNQGFIGCTSDAGCGGGGVCAPASGLLAIVEQFHADDNSMETPGPPGFPSPLLINVGTDAANGFAVDLNGDGSLQRPGHCRNDLTMECHTDADCTVANGGSGGFCRVKSTQPCSTDADCSIDNDDCTASGHPASCCTGAGQGTCVPTDFCDLCMNDEITFDISEVTTPVQ
jgi:hypothetical protein